jgi:hypothetical protein
VRPYSLGDGHLADVEGNVEHDIVLGSVERMHHISTSTNHAEDDDVTGCR